jgi:DNA-binding GntR family transcriptional regulator
VPEVPTAIERPLIREVVYETLQRWIVEGVLKPGEHMRDHELAQALGVSRTPVREALRRLHDQGLVETSANRWTRVAQLDRTKTRQIYPLLWRLEPLAIELATGRWTRENVERMREANARLRRALARHAATDASQADYDFHDVLVAASGNEELINVVRELKVRLRRLEVAYFTGTVVGQRSADEHDEILLALQSQQDARAAELVAAHWKASLARLSPG